MVLITDSSNISRKNPVLRSKPEQEMLAHLKNNDSSVQLTRTNSRGVNDDHNFSVKIVMSMLDDLIYICAPMINVFEQIKAPVLERSLKC